MRDPGYHRIIDRYINGEMGPDEGADFRKLLELDDDLRRLFEAERTISATMLKERDLLAGIDQSATYSRFLMDLAANVPSMNAGVAAAGTPASFWRMKLPLLLGAAGLLLLGALAFLLFGRDSTPPLPAGRPIPGMTEPSSGRSAPPLPTPPTGAMPPSEPRTTGARDDTAEAASPSTTAGSGHPSAVPPSRARGGSADTTASSPRQSPAETPRPKRAPDDIPTFEDSTIRTRLKVEPTAP